MAALDIHSIIAARVGQARRLDVAILQAVQLVVADQGVVIGDLLHAIQDAVVMGQDRLGPVHRPAIAAGLGQLQHGKGRIVGAVGLTAGGQGIAAQFRKGGGVAGVQPELAGIGAALGRHGGGLEPEQAAAATGKALVAPDGQFAGAAVVGAVAALHGVHGQGVGRPAPADGHGSGQYGEVLADGQVQVQIIGAGAQLGEIV